MALARPYVSGPGNPDGDGGDAALEDRRALVEQVYELREALERAHALNERLRRLDDLKNTLLHTLSHDLKDPLTAVLGAATTLRRPDLEPEQTRELLDGMTARARKMDRLLSDLLDLERLGRGIVDPTMYPVDVGRLVETLVRESDALDGREVEVDARTVVVPADAAKVERMVENLLVNAARHTPVHARVWVGVLPEDDGAVICVEDDGPGVPNDLKTAVFEAFRTGDGLAPGSGIGLSLVGRFAELHGGHAWVEDRPGGGASFRLPARRIEALTSTHRVLVAAAARAHDASSRRQKGTPISARTGFRHWFRRLALLLVILLWVPLAPVAIAGTAVTDIRVSATVIDFGETVTISGSVHEGPGCTNGRPVTLEWRAADSSAFAAVATDTTGGDGSFAFEQSQPHTGRYRASLAEQGACASSLSEAALVRVRALVDAAIVAGSTEAGGCLILAASVDPARAGQEVELQRKIGGAWTVSERLTLDANSETFAEPCLSFDDVGIVRLRVRWVAQDVLNETSSSPVLAFQVTKAPWMDAIEDTIGSRSVSVAVGEEDEFLYRRADATPRIPASNEKLLLSMVMLDTFGPSFSIRTSASTSTVKDSGVVRDLWILGRGDPRMNGASLGALAREIADAGVTRVRGRVLGSTAYFRHDWDAVGWDEDARDYVNLPTALSFEGNARPAPERRAAEVLTNKLEHLGVRVGGAPGSGTPPTGLETIAFVESTSLQHLLSRMLRPSDNFIAETLGKRLGVQERGSPGTIAKGAASIQDWTHARGAGFTLYDNSGLSYANRVTAHGLVKLLWVAEDEPWGPNLRKALPTGGQGTLRDRLHGVQIRAKTGTLTDVSALSGWILASERRTWVEFSILCHGMSKSVAADIEDEIVRILEAEL